MARFANNHIATRSYLENWTGASGQLMRVTGSFPFDEELRNPKTVGKRFRFFEDPEVAETAEQWLGRYEGRAAPVLRELSTQWPLAEEQRWALSCLIAIHIYRNPAGVHKIRELSVREMERRRCEYIATMNEDQRQTFYREVSSERFLIHLPLNPKNRSRRRFNALDADPIPRAAFGDERSARDRCSSHGRKCSAAGSPSCHRPDGN